MVSIRFPILGQPVAQFHGDLEQHGDESYGDDHAEHGAEHERAGD